MSCTDCKELAGEVRSQLKAQGVENKAIIELAVAQAKCKEHR